STLPRPPRSPPFPYTTLFRSPDAWTPQERARVLGAQFQLWTERIPDGRTLDYRAWPRGCALADVVWSGAGAPDLMPRLRGHLARSEEHTSELQSRENLVCRLL